MKDPHEVIKAGDIVKVKVMEVDVARKRIGLSMRLSDEPGESGRGGVQKGDHRESRQAQRHNDRNRQQQGSGRGSMGDILAAALAGNK